MLYLHYFSIILFIIGTVNTQFLILEDQTDILVNNIETNDQSQPTIAKLQDSRVVIAWASDVGGANAYDVLAKIYLKDGTLFKDTFTVNSYLTNSQLNPQICSFTDGSFTVIWESQGQQSGTDGIYAQIFDFDGTPVGSELTISTSTSSDDTKSSVACYDSDKWVVAYQSSNQEGGDGSGIYGVVMDEDGNVEVPEFHINTYTTNEQLNPCVIKTSESDFVVVWESDGNFAKDYEVIGRKFNLAGVPQTAEIHINYSPSSSNYNRDQINPHGAKLSNDRVIIAWKSDENGSKDEIQYKVFDLDLTEITSTAKANTESNQKYQDSPNVIPFTDGSVGILWRSDQSSESNADVNMQFFDNNGNKIDGEMNANNLTNGKQDSPKCITFNDNTFWFVWSGEDSDQGGIYAKFSNKELLLSGGYECDSDEMCEMFADPSTPYCSGAQTCVECLNDSQCTDPQNPTCNTNQCTCSSDSDCTDASYPQCDIPNNICIQCEQDSDCTDISNPICNSDDNLCRPCLNGEDLQTNGTCATCDSTCAECDGPFSTNCTLCFDDFQLQENGTCLEIEVQQNNSTLCIDPDFPYYNITDNQCIESCPSPNIQEADFNCSHPCGSNTSQYYFNTTNECKDSCQFPRKTSWKFGVKLCESHVDEETIQSIKELSSNVQSSQSSATYIATLAAASPGSGPSSLGMMILNKQLLYLRYLSISYPERLLIYFHEYEQQSFHFGLPIPYIFEAQDQTGDVPVNFDIYGESSSFLLNYWLSATTVVLIFLVGCLLQVFAYLAEKRNWLKLESILGTLGYAIKWSISILVLVSTFDEIILYSSYEFRFQGEYTSNQVKIWGNLLGAWLLFVICFYYMKSIYLVLKYQKIKAEHDSQTVNIEEQQVPNELERLKENNNHYHILFLGYKDKNFMYQGFLFFFMTRIILFTMVVALLFEHPMAQIILIMLINILILIYGIKCMPSLSLLNNLELIFFDIILLVANTSALGIAIIDDSESQTSQTFGNIIIGCFFGFTVCSLVFLLVQLILGIITVVKEIKLALKNKGKVDWVRILLIPFESGGLTVGEIKRKQKANKRIAPPSLSRKEPAKRSQVLPMGSSEKKKVPTVVGKALKDKINVDIDSDSIDVDSISTPRKMISNGRKRDSPLQFTSLQSSQLIDNSVETKPIIKNHPQTFKNIDFSKDTNSSLKIHKQTPSSPENSMIASHDRPSTAKLIENDVLKKSNPLIDLNRSKTKQKYWRETMSETNSPRRLLIASQFENDLKESRFKQNDLSSSKLDKGGSFVINFDKLDQID